MKKWFGVAIEAPMRKMHQMENTTIRRGRVRPNKTVGETIKRRKNRCPQWFY